MSISIRQPETSAFFGSGFVSSHVIPVFYIIPSWSRSEVVNTDLLRMVMIHGYQIPEAIILVNTSNIW